MVRAPQLLVVAAVGSVVLFLNAGFAPAQLRQGERSGHFRTARAGDSQESRRDQAQRSRGDGLLGSQSNGMMPWRTDRTTAENARDEPTRRQMRVSQRRQPASQQLTGEITRLKQAQIRGTTHRVVRLRTDNGQRLVVDLGPAAEVEELNLQPGAQITVEGPALTIGETRILWAQNVRADGQRVAIDRATPTLQGQVAEIWTAQTRRAEHRFARLNTSQGEVLVDLGPADQLSGLDLQGETLAVEGPATQVRNQPWLRAERIELNGDVMEIARSSEGLLSNWFANEAARTARRAERRDNLMTRVNEWLGLDETADGGQRAGQRTEMRGQRDGQLGQRMQEAADARTSRVPLGQRRELQSVADSTVTIPDRAQTTLTGEIVDTRTLDVQGATHVVVQMNTEQGDRRWIDLGPNRGLQLRLDRGTTLRVTGVPVQTQQGALLAAETLRLDNRQIRINRGGLLGRLRAAGSTFVQGEVQNTQTANVRGVTRQLATLQTDAGDQVVVDLGNAEELSAAVNVGDRIAVQGVALGLPNGPELLLAQRLQTENTQNEPTTATRGMQRR